MFFNYDSPISTSLNKPLFQFRKESPAEEERNLSRALFRKEWLFFFDIAEHSIVNYVKHFAVCSVADLVIDPAGTVALAYNC